MSISEKIVAAEKALEERRDSLLEVSKQYEENPEPEMLEALEEATSSVDHQVKELETYRRAEKALSTRAAEKSVSAPAIVSNVKSDKKNPVDYLFANAVATLEAHAKKIPFTQAVESRFGDDEGVKAMSRYVTKALGDSYTDNPPLATTFTQGWAQEITTEAVAGFMDLLTPESVVPRLPLTTLTFGGNSTIKVPMRAATPTMDADFLGEGDAIPVKYAGLSSKTLRQQKMGVIGTYTSELFERSTPNIVEIIRNAMVRDTAIKLDTAFLSNLAGSEIQPAGMQSLAGTPIDGSGMGNVDGAIAAIKAAIIAMSDKLLGARPAWVMHPSVAWSLQMMTTAIGQPAFPELANGTLVGIPVYSSVTVPADLIFLIDCAEIVFAYEGPRFAASDQATLHMADPASPLSAAGTPNEVAAPMRSLFQSDSMALRTIWHLTWDQMRDGAVVLINDVAV
jgi:HK97 family phage major capsid protein